MRFMYYSSTAVSCMSCNFFLPQKSWLCRMCSRSLRALEAGHPSASCTCTIQQFSIQGGYRRMYVRSHVATGTTAELRYCCSVRCVGVRHQPRQRGVGGGERDPLALHR